MKSTQDLIEEEFLRLRQQGHVEAFILFNKEGIPMAEVGEFRHFNKDIMTAISVLSHQFAELFADFHDTALISETSIRATNRFRLVSRPFQVEDAHLILIAIVPQDASYRKITNKAVRKIQQVMLHQA